MKGAGRAALFGAILGVALLQFPVAQDTVSLSGFSAQLEGSAALIELHTTGPASFQIDRFTMGDWINIWSRKFKLPPGVDEIPLEFGRPELEDLVKGISLKSESHRACVRLYLGPEADRLGSTLVREDSKTSVFIPRRGLGTTAAGIEELPTPPANDIAVEPVDAEPWAGLPPATPISVEPVKPEIPDVEPTLASNVLEASSVAADPVFEEMTLVEEPTGAANTSTEPESKPKPEFTPVDPSTIDDAAQSTEFFSIEDTAPAAGGFYIPRQPATAGTEEDHPTESIDDTPVLSEPETYNVESDPVSPTEAKTEELTPSAGPMPEWSQPLAQPEARADEPTLETEPSTETIPPSTLPKTETLEPRTSMETLVEAAEVNYQLAPPADDGGSGSGSGSAPTQDFDDLLEQATRMAEELLNNGGQVVSEMTPTETSNAGLSTPPNTSFFDPYQPAPAFRIAREETPVPVMKQGKEALSDITIELFEILNTPLDQAITLLIAPTDYNIIVDASVGSNMVSLAFKESQTDLKSALDLLTRTYGLAYIVEANTIVVAAKAQINGQLIDFETKLFVLSYADPKSVKDMLIATTLLGEDQIEIYKGEEITDDSTQLSGGGGEGEGSGTLQAKPIASNLSSTPRNALLVKAVPEQMKDITELIAELDRKPKLIELEVRVCEAGTTALQDLGIELNNNSATPIPTETYWVEQPDLKGSIEAFTAGSFHRSPLQWIGTLNTQIQEGSVELLAQPTLSTVEGKQAIYFAGEKLPYISKVTVSATGQTQIEVDFLNVGVTLNFKPRLDSDGKLTIDVNPIISSLLEFRIIGELMEAPRTSTRELATTVRVADCEPFVLAGLINDNERETITKVPLLGDMPVIGKLFRNRDLKGERTEIIVVVVPHIVNE